MKLALLFAIGALAVFNAMASPWLMLLFGFQNLWFPPFLPTTLYWMFGITGTVMGLGYLLVSGVPAALFDKATGQTAPTVTSRLIWLATMAAMSWPTLKPFVVQS